jgi:hypothetical protein
VIQRQTERAEITFSGWPFELPFVKPARPSKGIPGSASHLSTEG